MASQITILATGLHRLAIDEDYTFTFTFSNGKLTRFLTGQKMSKVLHWKKNKGWRW